MEERFLIGAKHFIWNKAKEKENIRKHGIDFRTASFVFNDDDALEAENIVYDAFELREERIGEPTDKGEQKAIINEDGEPQPTDHRISTEKAVPKAVIGEVHGILFVVFTERIMEEIAFTRIISARPATKHEAEAYFEMKYADDKREN